MGKNGIRPRRAVIAGAGPGALEALAGLRAGAGPTPEILLLAPEGQVTSRASAVAASVAGTDAGRVGLGDLADRHGATLVQDTLAAVDYAAREVRTGRGTWIGFDWLVAAVGARAEAAVPGAMTLGLSAGPDEVTGLLGEIAAGGVRRLAVGVPSGARWPLAAYQVALAAVTAGDVDVDLVTPEDRPSRVFGRQAADRVQGLLEVAGIAVHTSTIPRAFAGGILHTVPDLALAADRVVTVPSLRGPWIDGLPHDEDGFVLAAPDGRVQGMPGVFAVGDCSSFPVKHGSVATGQAGAVVETIVADLEGRIDGDGFTPTLQGILRGTDGDVYIQSEPWWLPEALGASIAGDSPLWWPPSRVVSRHLPHELSGFGPGTARERAGRQ